MSIWGKVIGGVAGFALGGPLGAILGTAFGHAIDRKRSNSNSEFEATDQQTRQTAFTVAMIVLSAKMAKADGHVTREEINTFKKIFEIPESEVPNVGRLFNEARQDAEGYEPYARQIGEMTILLDDCASTKWSSFSIPCMCAWVYMRLCAGIK